jgi:formyl-CoA transferase/CoA:oxalate CoA-transferase
MILCDLGAEIIKIERPGKGDDSRGMGPFLQGESCYFLNINRNKQSVVIDIRQEEGKQLVYELVKKADVFVENFRYGKAEQLGFGYEKLKTLNDSLIYCSISAFGQDGPEKEKPGYDGLLQARTGIMGITGPKDGPSVRAGVSILDQGSALWAAVGILSALYERKSSGKGQRVTTSLFETGLSWVGYHTLAYYATNKEPVKMGAGHAAFAPYGSYPAADGDILIGISNDNLFAKLAKALGRPEWAADSRFETNLKRVENRQVLDQLITDILKEKNASEWVEIIDQAGVPVSRVATIGSLWHDAQVEAISMMQPVQHPVIDDLRLTRLPIQLSDSNLAIRGNPPLLGEHTEDVLEQKLGLTGEQLKALKERGVIQSLENNQ